MRKKKVLDLNKENFYEKFKSFLEEQSNLNNRYFRLEMEKKDFEIKKKEFKKYLYDENKELDKKLKELQRREISIRAEHLDKQKKITESFLDNERKK